MARCSNAVVCTINFLTILIAVPLTSFGFYLKREATGNCMGKYPWLLIAAGIVLLVVSFFGIFGSCCRLNFFVWLYLFFMFLLILVVIVTVIFSFVVSSRRVGDVASELQIGSSSSWIQKWVARNWDEMERCLKEFKLCNKKVQKVLSKNTAGMLNGSGLTFNELTPLEIGCCRPPVECGFTSVNETLWEEPKSGFRSTNGDCKVWSNSADGMCFDCQSCKAGMVKMARNEFKMNAYASTVVLIYLIIIYSIGCCAFRNNRADKYGNYRG